ncbi:hypothetical protein [Thermococcus sp. CX2]|nr:hypothetical protein [Thermococcus sp. CX2]
MFERIKPNLVLNARDLEPVPEEETEVESRPKVRFLFEIKRRHLA